MAEPVVRMLTNGVRLVMVEHGEAPVSQIALVVGGATAAESHRGLDAWSWEVTGINPLYFPRGSMQSGAEMLASRLWFENFGAARAAGLSGSTATMDGQMYLLRAFAETTGRARAGGRHKRRRQVRRTARALRHDPVFVQGQAQWVHLLGDENALVYNPWLLRDRGARKSGRKVDRHIHNLWRPGNATLVVVGPVDAGEVFRKADRWFTTWVSGTRNPTEYAIETSDVPSTRVSYEVVDSELTHASLQLRCRVPVGLRSQPTYVDVWDALHRRRI
jgi:hypothetical protein